MPDRYSGHDPERGCGLMVGCALIVGTWAVVILALIGLVEVVRRVLG